MTKRWFAFTLAEVLITLGIIGVVAAMTLPALINNYQERVTVTKVKKFYSLINQAMALIVQENGELDTLGFYEDYEDHYIYGNPNKLASLFKSHLKVLKDCGTSADCIPSLTYRVYNNSQWVNYGNNKAYYKMILADGTYLWMRTNTSTSCRSRDVMLSGIAVADACGSVWIDVNGGNPPNVIGEDAFYFVILKNSIIPHPAKDCKAGGTGWGCSSYILTKGDMKYNRK